MKSTKDPKKDKMNMFFDKKNNRISTSGFTLIEFLIYSVIVSMLVGFLVFMSVEIIRGNAYLETVDEVNNNVRFSMHKITYHIRKADDFEIPNSSKLELTIGEETVSFSLGGDKNDVLKIQRNGGDAEEITDSEKIAVTNLSFTDLSYEDTPGTIRIVLSLERRNPLGSTEYDFQTTSYTTENLTTY